jgi:hypothetical protein
MGPQGASLTFATKLPTPGEFLAEAERLGGLPIDLLTETPDQFVFAFSEFPRGTVTISSLNANRLFLADFTLLAPVLFELLVETGVHLGGQLDSRIQKPALPLPLNSDFVRSATRRVHVASTFATLLLLLLAVGVVSALWFGAQNAP